MFFVDFFPTGGIYCVPWFEVSVDSIGVLLEERFVCVPGWGVPLIQ